MISSSETESKTNTYTDNFKTSNQFSVSSCLDSYVPYHLDDKLKQKRIDVDFLKGKSWSMVDEEMKAVRHQAQMLEAEKTKSAVLQQQQTMAF